MPHTWWASCGTWKENRFVRADRSAVRTARGLQAFLFGEDRFPKGYGRVRKIVIHSAQAGPTGSDWILELCGQGAVLLFHGAAIILMRMNTISNSLVLELHVPDFDTARNFYAMFGFSQIMYDPASGGGSDLGYMVLVNN